MYVLRKEKDHTVCFGAAIFFLVAYLHILAAKTGLVCLYAGCFIYFLYAVFFQKKWKLALYIIVIAMAMGSFFYYTMPTLRNRIQYVVYDFSNYSKGNMMPGYGDAARWLSIRAGMRSLHNTLLPVLVLAIY
jgi:O-antigen ligase